MADVSHRIVLFGSLRVVLPLTLLAVTIIRYNVLSLMYGLFLLVCPLIATPTVTPITVYTRVYLVMLLVLSCLFTLGHVGFHSYMISTKANDTGLEIPCSALETAVRSIGYQRLVGVDWTEIVRLIAPDILIVCVSAVALALTLRLQYKPAPVPQDCAPDTSDATTKTSPAADAQLYVHQTHRKIMRFVEIGLVLLFLGFSSLVHPGVLSAVYFISFLYLMTWVACWQGLGYKFHFFRVVMLVYTGLHLAVLYLYQFQVAQEFVDQDSLYARLLGLTAIIKTDCSSPSSFIFWPNKYPVLWNPGIILALHWVLSCETRYWWNSREFGAEHDKLSVAPLSARRRTRVRGTERQVSFENRQQNEFVEMATMEHEWNCQSNEVLLADDDDVQPNYDAINSTSTSPHDGTARNAAPRAESEPSPSPETEEAVTDDEAEHLQDHPETALMQLRSPLVTVGRFIVGQSYLFTLISMMAWSITYHCWLTFVFLLAACIMWMVPKPQRVCLPASPVILAYAQCLLIIQYIYGFNLKDDELPTVAASGLSLTQIGLRKYEYPWQPLATQIGFTLLFWMNLGQFVLQRHDEKREEPAVLPLKSVYNNRRISSLKRLASIDSTGLVIIDSPKLLRLGALFWRGVGRYWIVICMCMFLVLTLHGRVVLYKIVYMVLFLFFALGFQLFYSCWRATLFAFWWVVIIYSMIVLCLIYTYQFEDFPAYWHNGTGLSYTFLSDLGLEPYDTAQLFQSLLIPTAFLIIIILQVNYFHPLFMSISALDRYKDTSPEQEAESKPADLPAIDVVFRWHVNEKDTLGADAEEFLRFVVKNADKYSRLLFWVIWRVLEVHVFKLVAVSVMLVAVYDVSPIGFVFVIVLVVLMPSSRLRPLISAIVMIWAALAILAKMVFQLDTLDVSYWDTNCTTYAGEQKYPFNSTIDSAIWVGLKKMKKTDDVGVYVVGLIMLVLVLLFEAVVRVHQKQLGLSSQFPKPRFDIIFPATMRKHADDDFLSCLKFMANYCFYKFGLEVCQIMIAITVAVRSDSYAVFYAILLGLLLLAPRSVCARVWPLLVLVMVIVILLQYASSLGLPLALCNDYPWSGAMNGILEQWLHLPDFVTPPYAPIMMADFFVLLFVCLQYRVFVIERSTWSEFYGGGDNSVLNGDIDTKEHNPTRDFLHPKKSVLDVCKSIVFMHMFWLSLGAIFITSIQRINLFCLGYMIGCFAILWLGQSLLLRPRTKLLRVWGLLLAYNYTVILCRTFLQLIACVYYQTLHQDYCIVTELFSLVCQANIRIDPDAGTGSSAKSNCSNSTSSTLFWDVVCLIFIIIQRRAYCTHYFRHVVTEIEVQSRLSSNGARLLNARMIEEVKEYKRKEAEHLDLIRKRMEWLKEQQKRNGEDHLFSSDMHYTVIRSGDYTLFDDPDDEKYWGDLVEMKDKDAKPGALEVIGAALEGGTKAGLDRAKDKSEVGEDGADPKSSPTRKASDAKKASDEDEDEDEEETDTCYKRMKNFVILCWTVLIRSLESLLDFLMGLSKEYRTMAAFIDSASLRLKREMRTESGELTAEEEEEMTAPTPCRKSASAPAQDASAQSSDPSCVTITIDDMDVRGPSTSQSQDTAFVSLPHVTPVTSVPSASESKTSEDASQLSLLTRLLAALYYVIMSRSEVVCFFLLILDHVMSASVLSIWLPFSIFLWALLSVPRPTRTYWVVMITYLEAILILKFFFQFRFLPWNDEETRVVEANNPFWFPAIIGFALRTDFATYDLACLLAIFIHRSILKRYGLWTDIHDMNDDGEESLDDPDEIRKSSDAETTEIVGTSTADPETPSKAESFIEVKRTRSCTELITPSTDELTEQKKKPSKMCVQFRLFYHLMTANKYLKNTDVYTSMFFCDIIAFLIVVFGYQYFGPASAGDEGNVTSYLTENRIPAPFLAMLLVQFCFIVIDRALYLKKCVVGKLLFQISLVIFVHIWIFFLLPLITHRRFGDNRAAQLWYFVKCVYFGFSAYQITCGYPTQILGNILTRGYGVINKFAFKIFLGIPFLLELRSLMDWIWTQTSLDLLCWLTVEEIFANVFVVKCERKIEEAYPTPRGQPRGMLMKYLVGGSQLLLIILLIWFPLLLFSFAFAISSPYPPIDCTVEISVGGYQPLFKMSAQTQSILSITDQEFKNLRSAYSDGGKNQRVIGFMNNYESVDVRLIQLSGKSTSVWGISPPSQRQLHETLVNSTDTIFMYFQINFLRDAAGMESSSLAQNKISYPLPPSSSVRQSLAELVLNATMNPILIPGLFPRFLRVYANGKVSTVTSMTDSGLSNVTLMLKTGDLPGFTGTQEWVQVQELVQGTIWKPDPVAKPQSYNYLSIFAFNDRAAPAMLSFIPGTGTIIGIYLSFILVLGKVIRTMFTGLLSEIKFRQMPYVERVQELIYNLYLARESMDLCLEEELFAKLIFLYRSPETMIKYARFPKAKED